MALNPAFESQGTRKLPLCFGYVKAQGDLFLSTVTLNGAQFNLYLLGEGEWDGYEMVNSFPNAGSGSLGATPSHMFRQSLTDENPNRFAEETATVLHFHAGAYTPIGTTIPIVDPTTGLIPTDSSQDAGPTQGYDPWFAQFPSVTPPQSFSGIAYAIFGLPAAPSFTRGTWIPSTISGTCIWRTTKCRIFDAYGNVTGYGFTLNPAWHKVEALLRYKIRPQQPPIGGLTAAEKACINWEAVAELAARNDFILPNGNPRFVGNYAFAADASLANMMETMCRVDRSYPVKDGQQLYWQGDDARASVFIASRKHLVEGSTVRLDKKDVSKAPNMFVPQYRDLDIPAVCEVQTGVGFGAFFLGSAIHSGFRAFTCSTPSPFTNNSFMTAGGVSDPTWDGDYQVSIVDGDPYPIGTDFPNTTYCLMPTPYGTPTANVTGGFLGSNDARFSSRAPTGVQHRTAQKMVAQQNLGLAVQPRINRVNYDCGNSTFDQTNRLMKFERDSQLGSDTGASWRAPIAGTLSLYLESVDANGAQLPSVVKRRSVITLDEWLYPEAPQGTSQVQLRGTSQATSTAGTITVNLPAGSLAGDLAILFAAGGYYPSVPAGWTGLYSSVGNTWNAIAASKVLTGGDIATGSVTVAFSNAFDCVAALSVFIGATGGVRETEGTWYVGVPSGTLATSGAVLNTDAAIYFASQRNAVGQTINPATGSVTGLQAIATTYSSSTLACQPMPGGVLNVTYDYPSVQSQSIQVIVMGAAVNLSPRDFQVMEMAVTSPTETDLGRVELTLAQYNRSAYTDVSDAPGNQYPTVPGSSLKLSGFTPATYGGHVLNATVAFTYTGSTLTIAIPDLLIQVLGVAGPTAFPTFAVTGVPTNTPVTLYINYPTGLSNPPTFNWVAGSVIAGTYVIVVARGTFS